MTGNSATCGYVGRNVTRLALTSYIWKVNYRISVIFECSANCHMWLLILIIGCLSCRPVDDPIHTTEKNFEERKSQFEQLFMGSRHYKYNVKENQLFQYDFIAMCAGFGRSLCCIPCTHLSTMEYTLQS